MIEKKIQRKKTNTKSAENGHRKHRLHPFSQNISGKLAAPLLRETGEYCLRLYILATMKGKHLIRIPSRVLMALLWPKIPK